MSEHKTIVYQIRYTRIEEGKVKYMGRVEDDGWYGCFAEQITLAP